MTNLRLVLCIWLAAVPLAAQRDYDKPFPPHKVIGNVYFVGNDALGTYLITTTHHRQ